jgi:hypothetical protein
MTYSGEEPGDLATPEQEEELEKLAAAAGEEVPGGMRVAEAAQRIEELKVQQTGESG